MTKDELKALAINTLNMTFDISLWAGEFTEYSSDRKIAVQLAQGLLDALEREQEYLSHIPKLPMEPYEKAVSKKCVELEKELTELKAKYQKAIDKLKEISNEDFRGNRPSGSIKAFNILKELGEKG